MRLLFTTVIGKETVVVPGGRKTSEGRRSRDGSLLVRRTVTSVSTTALTDRLPVSMPLDSLAVDGAERERVATSLSWTTMPAFALTYCGAEAETVTGCV